MSEQTFQFTTRAPLSELDAIDSTAAAMHVTRSWLVREACRVYLASVADTVPTTTDDTRTVPPSRATKPVDPDLAPGGVDWLLSDLTPFGRHAWGSVNRAAFVAMKRAEIESLMKDRHAAGQPDLGIRFTDGWSVPMGSSEWLAQSRPGGTELPA